ncbi:MAG: hypothetical protein JNL08_18110 [Planctomycetes bacterium]|nr:hypothetical protein [Planctomycetota bacterium]
MSEPDDWEPLPEAARAAHPGELGAGPGRVAEPLPAPAPAPAPAPPRTPPPAPREDPAAAAALAQLKQRLASAPPATGFVAELQHREQRAARRRAAADAPFAAAAGVVRSSLRGAEDVPLPLELDAVQDHDPREDEAWFRALPEPERERLRAHWWHERHRDDGRGAQLQRQLGRAVAHGAVLFFVLSLLLVLLLGGLQHVPLLTVAGALAAGAASLCGGGRFVYAVAGAGAFVLVLGPMVLTQPLSVVALMLCAYSMGCLGMDGEMRRSGGFGDR